MFVYGLGGTLAAIYLLIALLLGYASITVSDLPLCSDHAAVLASSDGDCIESSSVERVIGLVLAYASVLVAATTVFFAVRFGRHHDHGRQLAVCALATPLLALGALVLLPISF